MILAGEVATFLDLVERGQTAEAVAGVLALHDSGLSCTQVVTEVLAPVQLEVGARWATAQWSVADEHVATAVVDDVLGALSARVQPPGSGPTIVLCSAEGEWHVTPLRMGALVLRDLGWQVRLLGASTPAEHLRATLRHSGADVAAVHCALPTHLHGVPDVAAAAHEAGLPVLAAGRGFGVDGHRATRVGCDGWAPDPLSGAALAETWLDTPPAHHDPSPSPHEEELATLRARREDLVDEAYGLLERRSPMVAAYDDRQRRHTLEDLGHILDAAATTMLVDDPRVMDEFVAWLEMVLVARGVPVAALDAGFQALAETASADLPALATLVERTAASGRG